MTAQPEAPRNAVPHDRAALAAFVDHTLLKPEATASDVALLVEEGAALGVFSVCVSPSFVSLAVEVAAGRLAVATVCGFPSGKHMGDVKAFEAARSVADEADEADIAAVRAAVPNDRVLKVIIESAALTDEQIVGACKAAQAAGADFVKTSTGFHPAGGATTHAVSLMARTVGVAGGGRLGVKASGGIRDLDAALAMIEAGATRLGLSGTASVLSGFEAGAATPTPSTDTY